MGEARSILDGAVLPTRYEALHRLGRGGGGEVWAVRERYGGRKLALKLLAADFGSAEVDALIRETVALSGLEGLGLPRVLDFGRLRDGRPFMVRELVSGDSLEALGESDAKASELLAAVARTAEVLTHLHRAGLLHGDVKPANVIVSEAGAVSLVDLGLSAPWRDGGAPPEGLTPHYAAPEVLAGQRLTARSEVFSLGVMLREIVTARASELSPRTAEALGRIVERATHPDPAQRYPSADELASALRHAVGMGASSRDASEEHWPVEGIEHAASALLLAIEKIEPGGTLLLTGPEGSGRSTLLRRAAWTLAMRGEWLLSLDESHARDVEAALAELEAAPKPSLVLVDVPLEGLAPRVCDRLEAERALGSRLVMTSDVESSPSPAVENVVLFPMPTLDEAAGRRLLKRAIPSLSEPMVRRVLEATAFHPGPLRRFVARAGSEPIASEADLERLVSEHEGLKAPSDARARAAFYLDHGRFRLARAALDELGQEDAESAWLEARYQLAAGTADRALSVLAEAEERFGTPSGELRSFMVGCRARAARRRSLRRGARRLARC